MNKRTELVIVVGIIVFVIACSLLPYIYGYIHTPDGMYYLGVRLNNFPDSNSYLNWIFQGSEGNFLFKQLYSIEGGSPTFFHPVFLILGLLMKLFGGAAVFWYHVGRIVATALLISTGYYLITYLVKEIEWRLIALVVFVSSSGLGWLFPFSADNTQIEATNFINMHESVLNPFSLSLILWTLIFFYYKKYHIVTTVIICGLFLNALIIIHSYDFIIVSGILFFLSLYNFFYKKDLESLRNFFYIIIVCLPAIMFQISALGGNSALGIWAFFQSSVPAVPNVVYYITGVGLQLVFLIVGVVKLTKEQRERWLPWLLWLALLPIFLWNPFLVKYQRKLVIGAFIPISLFAYLGIKWWYEKTKESINSLKLANILLVAVIFLLSVSNIMLLIGDFKDVANENVYVREGIKSASEFLRVQHSDIVLASPLMGNIIPSLSGKTVFVGHYDQTVNFSEKAFLVQELLISTAGKKDPLMFFAKQEQISYIFVDEEVRSWGGLDTTNRPYLKLVYENPDVQIYQIQKDLLN